MTDTQKAFRPVVTWDAEVAAYLRGALGPERFTRTADALSRPPLTTCLRVNTLQTTAEAVVIRIRQCLGPEWAQGAADVHLQIPCVVLLRGSGPHAVSYEATGGREVVVSRKAGEAVLRGAPVYAPGVLAVSGGVSRGDLVALSVGKERAGSGTPEITRGTTLYGPTEVASADAGALRSYAGRRVAGGGKFGGVGSMSGGLAGGRGPSEDPKLLCPSPAPASVEADELEVAAIWPRKSAGDDDAGPISAAVESSSAPGEGPCAASHLTRQRRCVGHAAGQQSVADAHTAACGGEGGERDGRDARVTDASTQPGSPGSRARTDAEDGRSDAGDNDNTACAPAAEAVAGAVSAPALPAPLPPGWTASSQGPLAPRTGMYVGVARAAMSRQEVFRCREGLAFELVDPVFRVPPGAACIPPGHAMLQNLPSVVAALALGPPAGSRVLDMCAAPGGKATLLAQLMEDRGEIVAFDRTNAKAAEIVSLAKELGVTCIRAQKMDAGKALGKRPSTRSGHQAQTAPCPAALPIAVPHGAIAGGQGPSGADAGCPGLSEKARLREERRRAAMIRRGITPPETPASIASGPTTYPPESFDHVLLDAPCSALGLRPRLQQQATALYLRQCAAAQRRLIDAAVRLLRVNGNLVYSTCTINPGENEACVRYLLDKYGSCMRLVPAGPPFLGGPGLVGRHPTMVEAGRPLGRDDYTVGAIPNSPEAKDRRGCVTSATPCRAESEHAEAGSSQVGSSPEGGGMHFHAGVDAGAPKGALLVGNREFGGSASGVSHTDDEVGNSREGQGLPHGAVSPENPDVGGRRTCEGEAVGRVMAEMHEGEQWLTDAEAPLVQRFDPADPSLDTIGFFIAKFIKVASVPD